MRVRSSSLAAVLACCSFSFISGCGSTSPTAPPSTGTYYSIGGTVSGVNGSGLILVDNTNDTLPVNTNGKFQFINPVPSGGQYKVSEISLPSGETCTIANGSGIATANVTNVSVVCAVVGTYSIGGTIMGLQGSGLVLQDNGGDNLPVSANGAFAFPTLLAAKAAYSVTILTQPAEPSQSCVVANGSGTAGANVTGVVIACPVTVTTAAGQWTWVGGTNLHDQAGSYGKLGTPSIANLPGGRVWSASWTDPSGNFWLFGGTGIDSAGNLGTLNDLWKYSNGQWTWMSGSNVFEQPGVYGTKGQPALSNTPGARNSAVSWVDAKGNLWLFGGFGSGYTGAGELNDLWEYSNGQWAWMGGSSQAEQAGVYGTLGVPDPANVPGARWTAAGWTDSQGNLWLFGGEGYDSQGNIGILNDLWEFSGGEWTWMGGSTVVNAFGVYGAKGTPAPANVPGARTWAMTWSDSQNDLWLFGGEGNDANGWACGEIDQCFLNDLWKYSGGEWTWMAGSNTTGQPGFYGLQSVPAPGNAPGGRESGIAWTDAQGTPWFFGGLGNDAEVDSYGYALVEGPLNDLWEYSNGEWIWMGGSNQAGAAGVYGLLGVAAAGNNPGARSGAVNWVDKSGNLWLFGGTPDGSHKFNDLWEFVPWGPSGPPAPPPPTVTYSIGGTVYGLAGTGLVLQDNLADNLAINASGVFTFPATLAAGENYKVTILAQPANPQQYCTVVNALGTAGANVTNVQISCTTFVAGHNQWTWEGGNQPANYGVLGQPAPGNVPPSREYAATWFDSAGNFWVFGGNAGAVGSELIGPGGQIDTAYLDFNDLWKYSAGEWTWVAGSNVTTSTQPGVYGTQGKPSSANLPGARHSAVTWTDGSGNLWLFGGVGVDSAGKQGDLNDLWEYSAGQWTWVAGSNLIDQSGVYGALGSAAAANAPGSRESAVGWIDSAGNLWLFGGWGNDSVNTLCYNNVQKTCALNDLWKFSNGQWTWAGGPNVANQPGVYGTQGSASSGNLPGARFNSVVSVDSSGAVWLFGGSGFASTTGGYLNDLWKYSGGQWTWVSGTNAINQAAAYGIMGVPAATNVPGPRFAAAAWTDASHNFWLFSGYGADATFHAGTLNDLWRFSNGQWTWMGGSNFAFSLGSYGTLGVAAPSNVPSARSGAAAFERSDGSFWLFGGGFNDLWEYQP